MLFISVIACGAAGGGSAPSASQSSAGQSQATRARDRTAEVTGIVWFANEIENAAIEKLIAAPRTLVPQKPSLPKGAKNPLGPIPLTNVYNWIQQLLKQAMSGVGGLKNGDQCPYECPPGICDPGCSGTPPRRDPPPLGDPMPPDLAMPAVHWSINALENIALEKLMTGVPYTTIRQSLSDVLTKVKKGP